MCLVTSSVLFIDLKSYVINLLTLQSPTYMHKHGLNSPEGKLVRVP